MMNNESHKDVANGKERARLIKAGIISNRPPVIIDPLQNFKAKPLTADQLEAKGFHIAAEAKRKYERWMTHH